MLYYSESHSTKYGLIPDQFVQQVCERWEREYSQDHIVLQVLSNVEVTGPVREGLRLEQKITVTIIYNKIPVIQSLR